jgi:hypothetical protein
MSEPQSTGYDDSPDTTDGPVGNGEREEASRRAADVGAALTTDPEAQDEDSVLRPGNEPD